MTCFLVVAQELSHDTLFGHVAAPARTPRERCRIRRTSRRSRASTSTLTATMVIALVTVPIEVARRLRVTPAPSCRPSGVLSTATTWNLPSRSTWVGMRMVAMLRAGIVSTCTGGERKPTTPLAGDTDTRTVTARGSWLDTVTTTGESAEDRL